MTADYMMKTKSARSIPNTIVVNPTIKNETMSMSPSPNQTIYKQSS